MDVGRLAEAAGEEKSAKPLMRSEFAPAYTQQNHKLSIGTSFFCPTFSSVNDYLPAVAPCLGDGSITNRSATTLLLEGCLADSYKQETFGE